MSKEPTLLIVILNPEGTDKPAVWSSSGPARVLFVRSLGEPDSYEPDEFEFVALRNILEDNPDNYNFNEAELFEWLEKTKRS